MKLENSWKFNFEIWMKVDEFHQEVKNVSLTEMIHHFQLKSYHLNVGWKIDMCM
jgi:cell division protein FtsB